MIAAILSRSPRPPVPPEHEPPHLPARYVVGILIFASIMGAAVGGAVIVALALLSGGR